MTSAARRGPMAGGRQITRNRASYSCHTCRRRKVKCDKVSLAVCVFLARWLIGLGSSGMRKLPQERLRMCLRCDATERYSFAQ